MSFFSAYPQRWETHCPKVLDDVQAWMRWRKKCYSEADQQSQDAIYPQGKWELHQDTQLDQRGVPRDWGSCCQTTLALSPKKSPKREERTSSFGRMILKSHSSSGSLDACAFSWSALSAPSLPIAITIKCSLVDDSSSDASLHCAHIALVQVRQDLTYSSFSHSFLQWKEFRLWQEVLGLDPDFTYQLAVWFK